MRRYRTRFSSVLAVALLSAPAAAQDLWEFDLRGVIDQFSTVPPTHPFWSSWNTGVQARIWLKIVVDRDSGSGPGTAETYSAVDSWVRLTIPTPLDTIDVPVPASEWTIRVRDDDPEPGPFGATNFVDELSFTAIGTSGIYEELHFRFSEVELGPAVPTVLFSTEVPTCLDSPSGRLFPGAMPPPGVGTATGSFLVEDPPLGTDTVYFFEGTQPTFPSIHLSVTPLDAWSEGCFGDGGDQMGCTNCPCANNATLGSGGGCKHSFSDASFGGAGARLDPLGEPSLSKEEMAFEMFNAVPGSFAVLNSGPSIAPNPTGMNPCATSNPGSGVPSAQFDGLRCIISGGMGPVLRHGGRPVDSSGAVALNHIGPDGRWGWGGQLTTTSFPNASAFAAGETRHFQAVFRDLPWGTCSAELNTSQRVTTTFTP